jgi:alpha-glucosidase
MRALIDRYDERVLIGEIYLPIEQLVRYYGQQRGAHLPLNFQLISLPWQAPQIAAAIELYEASLGEHDWPNWVLGNHDQPRVASRVGPEQARVAAMLLLTLRGTPTLYYGDEIGMPSVPVPPEQACDPQGRNLGPALSRDPARTPMRWDASASAGFSRGRPWLPVGEPGDGDVESQRHASTSMLALYRQLIALRRITPALHSGRYRPAHVGPDTLAYCREGGAERYLIALNLGASPRSIAPEHIAVRGRVLLSTQLDRDAQAVDGCVKLRPGEGLIVRLEGEIS